jgi:hypothetical protein
MVRSTHKENWIYYLAFAVMTLIYLIWKRRIRGIKEDKDIPLIIFLVVFIAVATSIVIHFYA